MAEIQPAPSELATCSAVLTLELNAPEVAVPAPLAREAAARLAGLVAADLERIVGGIARFTLVVPGALYDQTEVMRPGFPLVRALEAVFHGTVREAGFVPQLIALGCDDGRAFTLAALNPERRPGAGPLLMLPLVLAGPRTEIDALALELEDTLLTRGAASAATRAEAERAFGLPMRHLSYATLGDLCALLQVQLEQAGFAGLWQLLEHAFLGREGACDVRLPAGNRFIFAQGAVHTPFWTFDDWAQAGPGHALDGEALVAAYLEWQRTQRQYCMGLEAYALPVRVALAPEAIDATPAMLARLQLAQALTGDYLVETVERAEEAGAEARLAITHQFDEGLGTLAYTVAAYAADGRRLGLEHHYPLTARGPNAIAEALTARAAEHNVIHPAAVLHSPHGRCLDPAIEATPAVRH